MHDIAHEPSATADEGAARPLRTRMGLPLFVRAMNTLCRRRLCRGRPVINITSSRVTLPNRVIPSNRAICPILSRIKEVNHLTCQPPREWSGFLRRRLSLRPLGSGPRILGLRRMSRRGTIRLE